MVKSPFERFCYLLKFIEEIPKVKGMIAVLEQQVHPAPATLRIEGVKTGATEMYLRVPGKT